MRARSAWGFRRLLCTPRVPAILATRIRVIGGVREQIQIGVGQPGRLTRVGSTPDARTISNTLYNSTHPSEVG